MIHDLVRQAPERLYGSCIVNPNFLAESLQAMDICFGQWGFVQLGEMLPYIHDYKMDCEETAQLVRAAADFDVPVQVHLGTYWLKDATACCDGMVQMRDLLHCVDRVPDAKYILAHAIGCGPTPDYLSWADMYLDTISGLFPAYPDNFWVEIRDFQCPALPRAVAEIPGTRLLAGTDWTTRVGPPFQAYGTMFEVRQQDNPFPPQVQSFVSFLRQAGASEETIVRIGSENARALYRL